jgi:hypothetical protein
MYLYQLVPEAAAARGVPVAQGHERQIPRRAVGARNARARLRAVGNNPIACLMSVLLLPHSKSYRWYQLSSHLCDKWNNGTKVTV